MRLKELHLLKYGAFDGQVLRFQSTSPGLHIVFGQNEAGKSTLLGFLRGVLFGFPSRRSRALRGFWVGADFLAVKLGPFRAQDWGQ